MAIPGNIENAEIDLSANPPQQTHNRRNPNTILQGERLEVEQLEYWQCNDKCGSVDREQQEVYYLIRPDRRTHIPAHTHQLDHALIFVVPCHQDSGKEAKNNWQND